MAVRDRCVAIVLAAGLLLGMAGWQACSPWLGIVVAVLATTLACAVYRVEVPSRDRGGRPVRSGRHDVDGVSTPRRAAGRP